MLVLEDRITPTILHWIGGTAANGNLWSVASNWAEGQAPTSGDTLVFDTTTAGFSATTNGFTPTNDITDLSDLSLAINDASSAGDFTISGDALGLTTAAGAAIASNLSVGTAATINNDLTLGADTTVAVGLGDLTLGGVISGGYALTETGSPVATLTLNAANTYTGGTVLTSGIVAANTDTSLGSGALTLDGGTLANAGSNATGFASPTLANPFVVSAPSTVGGTGFELDGNGTLNADLTLANSGSLTLGGALSGAGELIENSGTTTLTGTVANSFTGGTTIYSGTLVLQKTPGINALVSPVTVDGILSTLALGANDQLNGIVAVSLGGGSTFATTNLVDGYSDRVQSLTGLGNLNTGSSPSSMLTVTGGGVQVLAGSVSGSGSLTYDGSGSLTLAEPPFASQYTSSYTGMLTVAAGSLIVDADFLGATADVTGGVLGGTGAVGSITATGGTFNPFAGVTAGTFNTASSSSAVASSLNGATFQADLAPQGASDHLALGSDATLDLTGATLALNATGATLASSYQIITSPTGGLSGTFTGLASGATITVAGQTLQINYTVYAVTLTNVGATTTTLHWIGAVSSNWSAAGNWEEGVAPVSGDTLIFDTTTTGFAATAAAFAPNDDIAGLTGLSLVINSDSSAGNFVIGGDGLGLATSGVAIAGTVSAGTNAAGTVATINNDLALGANTTVDVGLGALTLGGVISGGFSLTADGSPAGTLTLNAANTYTGGTVLTSGAVTVFNNTSLGTGTLTFNGGTLSGDITDPYIDNPFVVNAPSTIGGGWDITLSGNGILNANLLITTGGIGGVGFVGALSGSGGLTVDGVNGNIGLDGTVANSFTGGTTIIAGTVELNKAPGIDALVSPISLVGGNLSYLTWGADNQLNGGVSINSVGFLFMNGHSDTVAGLNESGLVYTGTNATAGLTVTGAGANRVTGGIYGSGGLTYDGTGALTLTASTTLPAYTGTLTAEQGALVVDSNFSGSAAIATGGGTLTGTGVVGSLSVVGTGTIAPGADGTGGVFSTAGGSNSSTLGGGTLQVNLNDIGQPSQLVGDGGATLDLTNAMLSVNVLHASAGGVFTIVTSATGGISGTFLGLPDGATFTAGGQSFEIHYTATAVTLTAVTSSTGIALTPSTLPGGEVGQAYNQSITASGGAGAVALVVSDVTNTTGLTISGTGTGAITISGTPASSGTVTFTVTPTDSTGIVYSFAVNAAFGYSVPALPPGEVGRPYFQVITATGGAGPVELSVTGVSTTTGLTISGAGTGTITISGTPITPGTLSITVTPTGANATGTAKVYSLTVGTPVAISSRPPLPGGEVGQAYNQSITTSGGAGAVALVVSDVTNTTGLTISGTGTGAITISGTPTSSGTVTFTVTPTDSFETGPATTYSFVVRARPVVSLVASAGGGIVTAYDPQTGARLAQFAPFGAYAGGIQVAVGDVTGDGYDDLVVMAGPGALNGLVQIYSGQNFSLLSSYFAFPGYQGAFNLAVGDLTGNGVDDVIFSTATGADFVFAYAGDTNNFIVSPFSAFGGFTGGVTVAAGDLTGVDHDEIIVGTASLVGAAGVFNQFGQLLQPYYFAPIPMNGVNVAAADLNDSGHDDLIFGAKNSTLVLTYDGESQGLMGYFFALPGQSYGVTVAAVDPTGDGYADIVTGFTGNVSAIALFTGLSFQLTDVYGQPSGAGGVNVAGGTEVGV